MSCFSGSNNIHFDFPPIMMDGRNFASWQPEAVINQRIQKQENITTNWNYRQYMQKNGLQIMKYNSMESCYDLGLDPHTNTNTKTNISLIHLIILRYNSFLLSFLLSFLFRILIHIHTNLPTEPPPNQFW